MSGSGRYAGAALRTARLAGGAQVAALRLPIRTPPPARLSHRRDDSQRLDGIAYAYLGDATASWRLCDAADAMAPDALAARPLVPIPSKGF